MKRLEQMAVLFTIITEDGADVFVYERFQYARFLHVDNHFVHMQLMIEGLGKRAGIFLYQDRFWAVS